MAKHELTIKITALTHDTLAAATRNVLAELNECETLTATIKVKIEDGDGIDVINIKDRIEMRLGTTRAIESEVKHTEIKSIAPAPAEPWIATPMGRAEVITLTPSSGAELAA